MWTENNERYPDTEGLLLIPRAVLAVGRLARPPGVFKHAWHIVFLKEKKKDAKPIWEVWVTGLKNSFQLCTLKVLPP
jgi:hypothetical protein